MIASRRWRDLGASEADRPTYPATVSHRTSDHHDVTNRGACIPYQ